MSRRRTLYLGNSLSLGGSGPPNRFELPAHHLVTHGVIVGMTGSGKTGLVMVTAEEALRARVPVLMIDVKGDLPNLLYALPSLDGSALLPMIDGVSDPNDERPLEEIAAEVAVERRDGLAAWGMGEHELSAFHKNTALRVITPGSTAGEPLHVLSSLERRSPRWDTDPEAARGALTAAVSLVLRLIGRDADPARSRDHVLLSVLAERRLRAGEDADLASLLGEVTTPPIEMLGALKVDAFMPKKERAGLAAALNGLVASPSFESWRSGAAIDIQDWLGPRPDGRTPGVILSVAHLDDEERRMVLGVIFEELLAWTRSLAGSRRLRALVLFDEVYGFLPPHPANPPTKRPIVSLMKQARAFGVGVVLATQNPMDLDYRALGNAGLWCLGRLQTNADRARVIEGMAESGAPARDLDDIVQRLQPRWFVVRDVHAGEEARLLQPRWAMSWLRGPMTRRELRAAAEAWDQQRLGPGEPAPHDSGPATPEREERHAAAAALDL